MNIEVSLFGPPQIIRATKQIDIGHRKSTALLVYLIVTKQSHSRDTLAELFWPNANASAALGNLRRALYRINRVIGENVLAASRKTISINPDVDLWVDVDAFGRVIRQTEEQNERDVLLLEEAVAYYKGDFMAGFTLPDCPSFDEWQFFQTESLKRDYGSLLYRLASYYEENRQLEKAVRYQRKLLALDSLSEPANRNLMSLYARTDQSTAALRQYEELRRKLEKELKIEPEDETVQLYEAIRARQITAASSESDRMSIDQPQFQPRNRLRVRSNIFIGRQQDLKQITALLGDSVDHRLITITGPGGIGKTRLAIEAAELLRSDFSDGVYFIKLGNLSKPEQAFTAIAEHIGLLFYDSSNIKQQLYNFLSERNLLLVLDNFDQLVPGAAWVTDLMEQAPNIKLLVTSCERLNLISEQVHPLAGLSYPDQETGENEQESEAVQLLIQLAQFSRPDIRITHEDLPHLYRICNLVGGMPLALVLAAGWLELLTFEEIGDEIAQNLDFLEGKYHDIPERHHSIRVAFEYSWNKLSMNEKKVLMHVSVFKNGFTREAAKYVANAHLPALRTLIDKSLIYVSDSSRYDLHQLIGSFSAEKLSEFGETEITRSRHSQYYLQHLSRLETDIKGQHQLEALNEIEADFGNISSAWDFAVQQNDFSAIGKACETLYLFFTFRSRYQEGVEFFQLAHAALANCKKDEVLPYSNRISARMYWFHAFYLPPDKHKIKAIQKLVTYHRKRKDHAETAFCLLTLGVYQLFALRDSAAALISLEQSLHIYQKINDPFYTAVALLWVGTCHGDATNINNLIYFTRESLELARKTGNVVVIPYDLRNLALAGLCNGDYIEAEEYCQEALIIDRKMRFQMGIADAMTQLGLLNFLRGKPERAQSLVQQGLKLAKEVNFAALIVEAQAILSLISSISGGPEKGYLLAEESLSQSATNFGIILSKWAIATAHYYLGDYEKAEKYLWEAIQLAKQLSYSAVITWLLPEAALIKYHRKQVGQAAQLYKLFQNHAADLHGWAAQWDELNQVTSTILNRAGEKDMVADDKKLLSLLT
jgi:DNA-binding SARP family transcriptional activator/predicted ATPase